MSTAGAIDGIIKTKPEPYKAVESLNISKMLLESAENNLKEKRYLSAYEDALGAIRMSAAALMFLDGRIAPTLEKATEYLREFYPKLDAEGWKKAEFNHPQKKGALMRMMEIIGVKKINEEEETNEVLNLAKNFVDYSERLVNGNVQEW